MVAIETVTMALNRLAASGAISRALRAAANYFNVHFASIRKFGGGTKR